MPATTKYTKGSFYALGGIYMAWAVNGILKTGDGNELFSKKINFEVEEIPQFDFGLRAGAEVQFKTGNMKLFLQADYSQGIQNLNKGAGNPARNSVAGISTGIILNLRKIISISQI